MAEAQK